MVGARVSVSLNGKLTVDHALMENYYDESRTNHLEPVPARGPIELQTHGGEIRWRNIFLREIKSEEANKFLSEHSNGKDGVAIWNGKDFDGWAGPVENYEVADGAIRCKAGKGGTIYQK